MVEFAERVRGDRTLLATLALAALALLARLVALGARPVHWEEARVGYWTLSFLRTGAYQFRPVAGAPLLYLVGRQSLGLLGVSAASLRLLPAVVGGLLPLAALLFRGSLDDDETVVLAALLAASPLLVYYSRFARGDVVLAAFGLVAVGCLFRARETGNRWSLYAGAAALALGAGASTFVVGYVACWLLAAGLVFDRRRVLGTPAEATVDRLAALVRGLREWATPLARALFVLLGLLLVVYGPRAGAGGGVGLWSLGTVPAAVESAFVGSVRAVYGVRVEYRTGHQLLPYVADYVQTLLVGALPVVALGLAGFLAERYGRAATRPAVAFAAFWGGATLLVFPVLAEVNAPWVAVHGAVPLAVPAAVGGGLVVRRAREGLAERDAVRGGLAAAVALLLVAQVGAVAATDVYGPPGDSRLAQFAQPADDLEGLVADVRPLAEANRGVDVVYVGEQYAVAGSPDRPRPPVPDGWGARLPLPWYFARAGAVSDDVAAPAGLADYERTPPVVVTRPQQATAVARRLDGYSERTYRLGKTDRAVVVFRRS